MLILFLRSGPKYTLSRGKMSYFRARKDKKFFKDFKKLTKEYWDTLVDNATPYGIIGTSRYTESEGSNMVREKIATLLPFVEEAAKNSSPANGRRIPINIFSAVIEPSQNLDRNSIENEINRSISIAEKRCKDELIRMLLPWNWIIFIIRIPFIILRRVGLPPKVEENIIARAIKKIVEIIILVTLLTYGGISLSGVDLINLIKNLLQ